MEERGKWQRLINLEPGAIFETRRGTRGVMCRELYPGTSQPRCVALDGGFYLLFENGPNELVREIRLALVGKRNQQAIAESELEQ